MHKSLFSLFGFTPIKGPRKPVAIPKMTAEQRAHNAPIEAARRAKMRAKQWARDNIAFARGIGGKSARRIHLTGRTT